MTSGGARARSGPAPDPLSRTSLTKGREWIELPVGGCTTDAPGYPFDPDAEGAEHVLDFWAKLWRKPQAMMWHRLRLEDQVAAYAIAYLDSVKPGAAASMKTAVLRMETELGLSVAGMRQNGWIIGNPGDQQPSAPAAPKRSSRRKTGGRGWLESVNVEGA